MVPTLAALGMLALCASYMPLRFTILQERPAVWVQAEWGVRLAMLAAALLIICLTIGFVGSALVESWVFFKHVSFAEFFANDHWNLEKAKLSGDFSGGNFGALGIIWDTLFIALLALLVAWPVGCSAAIYAVGRSVKFQERAKHIAQMFVATPSIVFAFIGIQCIAPMTRDIFGGSVNSALAVSITMGTMLSSWIFLWALEGFMQVPRGQYEGAWSLGLNEKQAMKTVIMPQAAPYLWAVFVAAISKAMGETMITMVVGGLKPVLSFDPTSRMSTIAAQVSQAVTGDLEADHPIVLACSALLLCVMVLSISGNLCLAWYAPVKVFLRKNSLVLSVVVVLVLHSSRAGLALSKGDFDWFQIKHQELIEDSHKEVRKDQIWKSTLSDLWERVLLRAWRLKNLLCFFLFLLAPLAIMSSVGLKGITAVLTTEITIQCQDTEPQMALTAVKKQLGLQDVRLSRDESRLLREFLAAPNDDVICGDKVFAGHRLDAWWKGKTLPWVPAYENYEGDSWANLLAAQNTLSLWHVRGAAFWNGDSRELSSAGIAQAFLGTMSAILLIVIAVSPVALAAAMYVHFYLHAKGGWRKKFAEYLEVLDSATISFPVIAYGILGQLFFIRWFGVRWGSGLVIDLTLGLVAFPYLFLAFLSTIKAIPDKRETIEASESLGFTFLESIWYHIPRMNSRGLFSGLVFAVVHAIGETAVLLPIGGKAFIVYVSLNPMSPATTLAGQVYIWSQNPEAGFDDLSSFAASIAMLISFTLSILGIWLSRRKKAKKPEQGVESGTQGQQRSWTSSWMRSREVKVLSRNKTWRLNLWSWTGGVRKDKKN